MALRVPPDQVESLKEFLSLPEDRVASLIDALSRAGLHFNRFDLAREVAGQTRLNLDLVQGTVAVLTSLYLTREANRTMADFLDRTVLRSLIRAGLFEEPEDDRWPKLRSFLESGLNLERTIGTAAKSGPVLTQHERIFRGASIVTDFRPIFHVDPTEKPEVGYVVHMLHIEHRDPSDNEGDLFFALDTNDLQLLRTLVDRAIAKENSLRETLQTVNLEVLKPGNIY